MVLGEIRDEDVEAAVAVVVAASAPMPACALPSPLNAIPDARPISENVPSRLFRNSRLGTESFATKMSAQPSPSRSENSTPKP